MEISQNFPVLAEEKIWTTYTLVRCENFPAISRGEYMDYRHRGTLKLVKSQYTIFQFKKRST